MSAPFKAVVANSFHGEDGAFKRNLRKLEIGHAMALKLSHAW